MLRCLLLVILLPPSLFAQTATLRGQVTDQSGAMVPAAIITLTDAKGLAKTTTADNHGAWSFAGLAPGNYGVQGSAPQLALAPVKISLKAGAQTLNLQLKVASLVEKLTVADNAGSSVSTAAANNASAVVLTGDDLDALADNPDDLLADLQALAGPAAGPNGGAIFIDGFSGGELPPKESIREIRINQNPFAPEYDKLGLGRIEIFTKPGADKYRGTVDYNLGTEAWNSRNPYASQKAPFLLQEFEGNAGGPITKHTSFTLDAQRNMVDNGSITNGFVADPKTFAVTPFNSVLTTEGRFTRVSPRIDYQLNSKHTLTFRYGVTRAGARDAGIGGFDLISRGYHTHYLNQTVQAADTAVFGATVNETRFQHYRSASEIASNTPAPAILVLGAFNGGGSTNGHSLDTQNSFELQNYTSMIHGTHSWKFGVRLRGQTDDSVSPQNFNGTFTFGGGSLAPVLDANHQPVLDASGQPVFAPIQSIERYYAKSGNGIVYDGAVRDINGLKELENFTSFVRSYDPSHHLSNLSAGDRMNSTMIGINIPIRIGHATVMPGDVVLGRDGGVMFIPPQIAQSVVEYSEITQLRDHFGHQRLRGEIHGRADRCALERRHRRRFHPVAARQHRQAGGAQGAGAGDPQSPAAGELIGENAPLARQLSRSTCSSRCCRHRPDGRI